MKYLLSVLPVILWACSGATLGEGPLLPFREGTLYGFIDRDGDVRIAPQFAYALPFNEGMAGINIGGTTWGDNMPTDGKWGFIDESDTIKINPKYHSPPTSASPFDLHSISLVLHQGYEFSQGLAAVYTAENEWIYIDTEGKPIIEGLEIQSARKFTEEGIAAVYIDRKWGYIDTLGRTIVPPRYLLPEDFDEKYAMVMDPNFNLICIDQDGNPSFEWYRFTQGFEQGFAIAKARLRGENNTLRDEFQHILVNMQGANTLVTAPFERLGKYGFGLVPALVGSKPDELVEYPRQVTLTESRGGKWGFIDTLGNFKINPIYADAKGFSDGLAAVKISEFGDWGFIDPYGNWVVEPGFRRVGYFKDGLCRVTLGISYNQYFNHTAYINTRGNVVAIMERGVSTYNE